MGRSGYQTSRYLMREALRDALLAAAEPGRSAGGIGSVPWRAAAVLYSLLGSHSIDRRGRCRTCHGRCVCRVLVAARYYLHQPADVVISHVASELGEPALATDPDTTDVLPRVTADPIEDLPDGSSHAVSLPDPSRWEVKERGEAGVAPPYPRYPGLAAPDAFVPAVAS